MDLKVVKQTGESFTLSEKGIIVQEFIPGPIEIKRENAVLGGRAGKIPLGVEYGTRKLKASLLFMVRDQFDYLTKRDEVVALLTMLEPFYVREGVAIGNMYEFEKPGQYWDALNMLPRETVYIDEKQWFVETVSLSDPEQIGMMGKIEWELETYTLPFGESLLKTSLFEVTSFTFDYLGNAPINPRYMPLEIAITGVGTNATITNTTTGESMVYTGAMNASNTLRIDSTEGMRITKDKLSVLRNTNKTFISLAPGKNDFIVTNLTDISVTFTHKNYYK
ncbi:tail protein [Psychrobacillus insolitus]|uniref:Tail protein n=1 Tax=Psychrobacillus insolitus TaxID=1461 RepID=A0A2W7MM09_9BACI|nr:phage tail domain-containing protein [Psychrobacillus insolitus]PZX07895.1 tail protein [Psychrobacillus insolitus]